VIKGSIQPTNVTTAPHLICMLDAAINSRRDAEVQRLESDELGECAVAVRGLSVGSHLCGSLYAFANV